MLEREREVIEEVGEEEHAKKEKNRNEKKQIAFQVQSSELNDSRLAGFGFEASASL